MKQDVLQVTVKSGCEQEFENYCNTHGIFYKSFPIEIPKTIYRAECNPEQLNGAEALIVKIEDMPVLTLSQYTSS